MIKRQHISDVLRHPFMILVVTAVISQWLIPRTTRQWQDHQRQAEIKVQLVTETGRPFAKMLVVAQSSEFGGQARDQDPVNRAFTEWESEQVVVSARIRAYSRDTTLPKDWD